MRNYHIIPRVTILMAQDDKMIRHWITLIGRLQPIAQLHGLAESGLGEVDMINVGSLTSSGGCGTLSCCTGFWCFLSVNLSDGHMAKQCIGYTSSDRLHDN